LPGLPRKAFTDHLHNQDALNLAEFETGAPGLQAEQLRILSISCWIFHHLVSLKPLAGKDFTAHVALPADGYKLSFTIACGRSKSKKVLI
jgi:hypothetical protein